jgi:hypothetical protein
MKTKILVGYIDLFPGWQDCNWLPSIYLECDHMVLPELQPGSKRFRLEFEVSCFGGSADAEPEPVKAINVTEVKL